MTTVELKDDESKNDEFIITKYDLSHLNYLTIKKVGNLSTIKILFLTDISIKYDDQNDLFEVIILEEKNYFIVIFNFDDDSFKKIKTQITPSDYIITNKEIEKIDEIKKNKEIDENIEKISYLKKIYNFIFGIKEIKTIYDIDNSESNKYIIYSSPILKFDTSTKEIENEIDKHKLGIERHQKINKINKKIIAFHETGHVVMSFILKDSELPTKACINIGSEHLGVTMYDGDDEDLLVKTTLNQLMIKVFILFSGRLSKKKFTENITTGAENDYLHARKILLKILMNGMIDQHFNYVGYEEKIPDYVEKILMKINNCIIENVEKYLEKYSDVVKEIAKCLEEKETINCEEIKVIFATHNKEINKHEINEIITKLEKIIKNSLNI